MNRLTPIAAAMLALYALPFSAHAQESSAASPAAASSSTTSSDTSSTLKEVVVEGQSDNSFNTGKAALSKLPADLHDVPQSVTVVNKALMQSQGVTSLADALRDVPGITIGGAEGGQIGNNINLNGFSARTDIYLDGFRDRAQYYRDTFALEEVEVLMGPSSMLFGRGSTGGAINQVSKKANTSKDSTDISASVTTNGLVRSTVDTNHVLSDTSAYRVEAMAQSGKATTRDQSDVQDFGLAGSYVTGLGTSTEITLSGLIQHNHDMPDYGLPAVNGHPINVSRDTSYGLNSDRTNQDILMLSAGVKHKITEDISFRNQTQFNYVHTDAIETSPHAVGTGTTFTTNLSTSLPTSSLLVETQSHDRSIHDYSIFNQSELTAKVNAFGFKHDLLAGFEIGHDGYDNQAYTRTGTCNGTTLASSYVDCVSATNPSYSSSNSALSDVPGNHASGSANTIAAYANDTMDLTPHFKLVGGLRYDIYAASVSNTVSSPSSASQTIRYLSVRGGGIWQPTDAQSYYVSYSTSFDPSLEQLTGTTGQTNLDPVKNKAYEVGTKWDLSRDLSANAAIYRIVQENARSQIETGVYALEGTVRSQGVRTGLVGHLNKDWQVNFGYTYMDAQVLSASSLDGTAGKIPVNAPKHTVTSWTTYDFMPGWQIGGGATYMSQRYATTTNTVQVGGYVRYDATLAYIQKKYDIRLNLLNLTNKMYYDALIASDGGRAVPGSGRTAMLTVNYHM